MNSIEKLVGMDAEDWVGKKKIYKVLGKIDEEEKRMKLHVIVRQEVKIFRLRITCFWEGCKICFTNKFPFSISPRMRPFSRVAVWAKERRLKWFSTPIDELTAGLCGIHPILAVFDDASYQHSELPKGLCKWKESMLGNKGDQDSGCSTPNTLNLLYLLYPS